MARTRLGDCYEAAGKYMLSNSDSGCVLVHGIPMGQGPIAGIRMGHAWVEQGDLVIDNSNGRSVKMPKAVYYALGQIEFTIRYTMAEFMEKVLESKHWGPWDRRIP